MREKKTNYRSQPHMQQKLLTLVWGCFFCLLECLANVKCHCCCEMLQGDTAAGRATWSRPSTVQLTGALKGTLWGAPFWLSLKGNQKEN